GLAERDGVALQEPVAARARRRQHREVDLVPLEARHALDAADQRRVAVDLEQTATAGDPVEVVDVLGDRRPDDVHVLELDERVVAGIRLGARERVPQLAHGTGRIHPVLPRLSWIGEEALVTLYSGAPRA